MRPPLFRAQFADELVVDNFAGGGGASTGIASAIGRAPDIAINHDPEALAMHAANHPQTRHYCEDVFAIDPVKACAGRPVGLAWFSPDCTFHSKARGAKPHRDRNVARRRRGLAWVVIKWAKTVRPRVICLENVEEFEHWGPLDDEGRPDPGRRGTTFRRWVAQLEGCGYRVEWRQLRASDYGAPTIRRRLFIIARCDGQPIVWPSKTHGPGTATPFRTAAECIDWSLPCPSIFGRKKPLAEATQRRIARGIQRFVIGTAQPFIVPVSHGGDDRIHGLDEPVRTVTSSSRSPFALVAPAFINTRNGERQGQDPRVRDPLAPYPTITALGSQGALVAAFLARHVSHRPTGGWAGGTAMQVPAPTVTAKGRNLGVITSHLLKFYGTADAGVPVTQPMPTVTADGWHLAEVRAFLLKYYGTATGSGMTEPLHTITTKDRLGLVTVQGDEYAIVDIGFRMLSPRELFRAQGFPEYYVIDPLVDGKPMTKTEQIAKCGNSVCPPIAEALVMANQRAAENQVLWKAAAR